jgi:alkylated DNA repair dioxygenase AlkB
MKQVDLFPRPLPSGLKYRAEFISVTEQDRLLEIISTLPLKQAEYKEFTARRRTLSYGSSYDFSSNESLLAPPIPEFLHAIREQVAVWSGEPAERFVQALIAEYRPGTPLGWHRDVPEFEVIAGVSVVGNCRMRFRPYPWKPERKKDVFALDLEPRSAYLLRDAARWGWQHSIPPTPQLRYSITFRTRRTGTEADRRR